MKNKTKLKTQFNSATKHGGKLSHINKGVQWFPISFSKPLFLPPKQPSLDQKGQRSRFVWCVKECVHQQKGGKTFTHGTSIQTDLKNSKTSLFKQIEGTSSYSVSCNITNSADRKVRHHGDRHLTHAVRYLSPTSHGAFLPTALLMFQIPE